MGQALTEENFTKLVSFKSGNLALLAEVLRKQVSPHRGDFQQKIMMMVMTAAVWWFGDEEKIVCKKLIWL